MAWTNVPKPQETSVVTFTDGVPFGLLIALTQSQVVASVTTGWGDIEKPTSSVWTLVAKPTS